MSDHEDAVDEIFRIRAEILKLDRRLITWNGGRGRKRRYTLADDPVGYGIRFVQAMRLAFELLDVLGAPVYERDLLVMARKRCERCGASKVPLVVHHKTYERLGDELPDDLEVLCRPCHRREHGLEPAA